MASLMSIFTNSSLHWLLHLLHTKDTYLSPPKPSIPIWVLATYRIQKNKKLSHTTLPATTLLINNIKIILSCYTTYDTTPNPKPLFSFKSFTYIYSVVLATIQLTTYLFFITAPCTFYFLSVIILRKHFFVRIFAIIHFPERFLYLYHYLVHSH